MKKSLRIPIVIAAMTAVSAFVYTIVRIIFVQSPGITIAAITFFALVTFGITVRLLFISNKPLNPSRFVPILRRYYSGHMGYDNAIAFFEDFDRSHSHMVDRFLRFVLTSSPFQLNYDSFPKKDGIEGWLLWLPNAQGGQIRNGSFDTGAEVETLVGMGLLKPQQMRIGRTPFDVQGTEGRHPIPYSAAEPFVSYHGKSCMIVSPSVPTLLEVYFVTEKTLAILEAVSDSDEYNADQTWSSILGSKLSKAATVQVSGYKVVDRDGTRFAVPK